MNDVSFYIDDFIDDIIYYRCKVKRISIRKACEDIGVSKSTLSRIERGSMPDVLSFARICKWINKPMDKYFKQYVIPQS